MYRPGTNRLFLLILILPFFLLGSCRSAQVLGLPQREAAGMMRNGDISFILLHKLPTNFSQAVSRLGQLKTIHPAAPFYAGLLAEQEKEQYLSSLLFCAALESPSLPAKREAILKLIPMVLKADKEAENILGFLDIIKSKEKTEPLLAACLYRLGRYNEAAKTLSGNNSGDWGKALTLFSAWKSSSQKTEIMRQEISAFLFEASPRELLHWAQSELLSSDEILYPNEQAALSARLYHNDYRTILNRRQQTLEDGGTVFFHYPELLADLGRAFQYTHALREEGAALFWAWDKHLDAIENKLDETDKCPELTAFIKTLDKEALNARKYRILFYSGRIERARGQYNVSSDYFNRALMLAPDEQQSDACIWYMLMNSLAKNPIEAVSLAQETMSQWSDISYFDDFLDRLSCYLIGKRQWTLLLDIFNSLERQSATGASLSQYAWILGRATEENYIKTDRDKESFFHIAFEEKKGSFYYRAMAASKLGAALNPINNDEVHKESSQNKHTVMKTNTAKAETEFILGFFECGTTHFALPYIQVAEEKLSAPELRKTADALAAAGRWKESLDLIARYSARKDHEMNRQDLQLFYPQPYKELIEKYAKEAGLRPEILYGLIRTESYFMNDIVSRSGATGLTQLMAPTAAEMAGRIVRRSGPDYRGPDGIDLADPEINIHLGSYYLKYLREQTGGLMPALLAYNGGMGRVRRALAADRRQNGGLPPDLFLETVEIHETREYGRRVLAAAAIYGYLYYDIGMEKTAAFFTAH